ncbi:hypothetical protein B0H10DRAFT_371491 [Mycena sp. CBHHK59/15]|nr:hypothetical protein B0H10DRAFT_371491 [Mycena sp. CBHHK59/15]
MAARIPTTDPFSPRSVPMKVLVLGFCRTGTASMRAALAVLGYGNTHHIGCVMASPSEIDGWTAAIEAKFHGKGKAYGRNEWDRLLGEFQAVADVPGILFAEELIHAYPDAQVILTMRDPDRWWKSFRDTLLVVLGGKNTRLARWLDPHGYGRFVPFARRNLEILLGPLDVMDETDAKVRYARITTISGGWLRRTAFWSTRWARVGEGCVNFCGKMCPTSRFRTGTMRR